jgi:hypothetical protein
MRLLSRAKFPPGGFRFLIPQLNWSISPWISFDAARDQIIAIRKANPYQTQVNGWSTDPETVGNELEDYNVKVCQEMGWTNFITAGNALPLPKTNPLLQLNQSAHRVVAGVETIREWEISGGNLVPQDLAEARAQTCSQCPKNGSGDLLSIFTEPAAALIKKQLEVRNNMKIQTRFDPVLGVCDACACPLKLKVHCPLEIINAKIRPQDRAALHPDCWILKEPIPAS